MWGRSGVFFYAKDHIFIFLSSGSERLVLLCWEISFENFIWVFQIHVADLNRNLCPKKSSISLFDLVPELQAYLGIDQHLLVHLLGEKQTPLQLLSLLIREGKSYIGKWFTTYFKLILCFFSSGRLWRSSNLRRKWFLLCIWHCELGWSVWFKKQARSLYPGDIISPLDWIQNSNRVIIGSIADSFCMVKGKFEIFICS